MHALAGIAASLLLAALTLGQDPPAPKPDADPYTRGDAATLAKLGYVSFGPFPLADGHGTEDVDQLAAVVALRWLETAHFRLGSGLVERPLPDDPAARRMVSDQCRRLRARHRGFPATPRALDPWLQVHLLAQRLETAYAEFQQRAGIDAAWLAAHPGGIGEGPYLGCREKFVVLVFQTQGDLVRYLRRHTDCREDRPWIQNFARSGCFLLATAAEAQGGALADPQLLHGHVLHGVCHNLLDAFCGLDRVPFWLGEGLAHCAARAIDPRIVDITNVDLDQLHRFADWEWPQKVKARLATDSLRAVDEALVWYDGRKRDLADHAMIWSLADFVLRQEPAQVAAFLQDLRLRPLPSRYASREQVLAWHDRLLGQAFGWDRAAFAANWRRHAARGR